MESARKYHSSKRVSEWDWTKANNGAGFSLKSTIGLLDYTESSKFALIKVVLTLKDAPQMEGTPLSTMHHSYSNTYCNVFAPDLARQVLFPGLFVKDSTKITDPNYAPWGANQGASLLHDAICNNNNGHFKAVTFDEAWQYTNSGYVVYLTAYNSAYYVNSNNSRVPGHIATCYETNNYENYLNAQIIQAGGGNRSKLITFSNAWGTTGYGTEHEHIKANLYLGYIIK